ncbi:MAG: TonB family protein [Salinibacter sp.]|uniref:TonB family protein n=1 Tax=Salinibacter sp. TaxID=2065818 RepID=UPI0035D480F2
MTWTTILDLLADLGAATAHPLWLPILAWTGLALPLWVLLERTDRLHPHAEYRLSQVLLAALPIGIAAAGAAELLPTSAQPPALPTAGIVVLPSIEPAVEITSTGTPSWHWMHAVGLVTAIALIAGLVGLGRLALDTVAAIRVRRTVEGTAAAPLQARVDRLREILGIGRPVQVLVTSEAAVPITLGGPRPLILLPEGLTENPEALRTTLVHECVHVRRWDDLAHVAERLITALFAVHPLVQRLRRRIVEARERACDAAVLGISSTSAADYARLLAAFAEGNPRPGRLGALCLSESPSSLKDRLTAMRSSISTLLSSRLALGTALLATGLALTLGVVACSDSLGPAAPEANAPTSESTTAASKDSAVYVVVEQQPKCGGLRALQEKTKYPEFARKAGIEGRVFVQFIVDEQGEVTDPTVTRGAHELLNKAALNAVESLDCEPGRQDGEAVKVQMALPVTFRLPDDSSSTTPRQSDTKPRANSATAGLDAHYYQIPDRKGLSATIHLSHETRSSLHNKISYPALARKAGMKGRVRVRFAVDEAGHAANPRVVNDQYRHLDNAPDPLARAALQTVKNVTFIPESQSHNLAGKEIGVQFQFRLPDEGS